MSHEVKECVGVSREPIERLLFVFATSSTFSHVKCLSGAFVIGRSSGCFCLLACFFSFSSFCDDWSGHKGQIDR